MCKRLMFLFVLVGLCASVIGCDSGEEGVDEFWDQLLGNWALTTFQGSQLPVQLPMEDAAEILESGDLVVTADTTWQMRLNGSSVHAEAGDDWVITLSGAFSVVDHSVEFAIDTCVEVGGNPDCPASVAGAEISAWNWTDQQLLVAMLVGDQSWSLGFAR